MPSNQGRLRYYNAILAIKAGKDTRIQKGKRVKITPQTFISRQRNRGFRPRDS